LTGICDCHGTVHYKLISESKTVNKEMCRDILTLQMWSEENAPKNEDPTAGFSIMTLRQHTGQFWSRVS